MTGKEETIMKTWKDAGISRREMLVGVFGLVGLEAAGGAYFLDVLLNGGKSRILTEIMPQVLKRTNFSPRLEQALSYAPAAFGGGTLAYLWWREAESIFNKEKRPAHFSRRDFLQFAGRKAKGVLQDAATSLHSNRDNSYF